MEKKKLIAICGALVLLVALAFLAYQYTRPAGPAVDISLVDKEKMVFTALYPDEKNDYLAAVDLAHKWPRQDAIIVVEPAGINLTEFALGDDDPGLETMMDHLAEQGLGDSGTVWLPFSEYNNNGGDPEKFKQAVNHFAARVKSKFPNSRIGVLLDCRSDLGYAGRPGNYGTVSLMPYINGLDKKNVTVLFFQGFPRVAPDENVTRAATFLSADRAIEAANGLGTNEITFVTGTASVYGADGSQKITNTPAQRGQIFDDAANQIDIVRRAGYKVKVVIFAENKDKTQADWSYTRSKEDLAVLRKFMATETAAGTEVSLFDPKGEIMLSSLT